MKRVLVVIAILILVLSVISCAPETIPEPKPAPEPPPTTTVPTPALPPAPIIVNDKPLYPENEAKSIIWTSLPYSLPEEYSSKHLLRDQLKISYASDNRWTFEAVGIREVRELLHEIEKITDVKWVNYLKEKYTSYKLHLSGDFYEKSGIVDVINVAENIDSTRTNIIIREDTYARLERSLSSILPEYIGDYYVWRGFVRNMTLIPLHDITVEFTIYEENTDNIVFQERYPIGLSSINDKPSGRSQVLYYEQSTPFCVKVPKVIKPSAIYDYDWDLKFYSPSGNEIRCYLNLP